MSTALKFFVELRSGTTLYIPFREASKVCKNGYLVEVCLSPAYDSGLAVGRSE